MANVCVRDPHVGCGQHGDACEKCGACEVCSAAGACDIDPASTWTILCASAVLTPKASGGQDWDPATGSIGGSAPDPFCQFELVAHQLSADTAGDTDTLRDTTMPTWNQSVMPPGKTITGAALLSATGGWRLWIGDDDGCTVNGCLAEVACEINPPLSAQSLRDRKLTATNLASCSSLAFGLVCTSAPP